MVSYQTGNPRGTYHRGDPHPTVEGRVFDQYRVDQPGIERWVTPDQLTQIRARVAARTRTYAGKVKPRKYRQVRRWRRENPGRVRGHNAKRRALKREHAPDLTEEERARINTLYETAARLTAETGERWDVDHSVPLSWEGPELAGERHHPDNLQVVPAAWNCGKGNRVAACWVPWPDDPELARMTG